MTLDDIRKVGLTYDDLIKIQLTNIIANQTQMKLLVKQCLSIVQSSTAKDEEIVMWISAAVSDMVRQDIDVASNLIDGLIQGAIVLFVKGTFGNVDIKEKELALRTYNQIVGQMSLSKKYKLEVDDNA